MQALLSELANIAGARFEGDGNCLISSVSTLSDARQGEITFLTNDRYRSQLFHTKASAVILSEEHRSDCPVKNLIISSNPYLSYALIAQYLDRDKPAAPIGIHSSAVVDKSAEIADSVSIAPLAVIGKNVKIHADVVVGAGVVIGDACVIGKGSVIHPRVTLYPETRIGENCLLHAGSVIGSDGFGFANKDGAWVKIPQTGKVIIGDNVEVGANTAIDRGAINDTLIGDGVKLDNLIQIAHNVSLGQNTAIAGLTAIAGSTSIGKNCTIGGCSGVVGHLDIADNVHVSAMTIVTKSLSSAGQYTGNVPAMPHRQWAKNMVVLKHLEQLNKKIKLLEKKLENLE